MDKKELRNKRIYIYVITFIGILIDQITKIFINYKFNNPDCINCLSEFINLGGKYKGLNIIPGKGLEIIKNFFYITYVENTGGAWGIFSGNVVLLALVSSFVVVMLYSFLIKEKQITKIPIFYYGLLFAGIIGNLIDRLFYGHVIDFFNFYMFGYDYPVFNIADIFIVVGIILMVIDVVRGEIYAYKKRKGKC